MTRFELSKYPIRQLDPTQGTKPLDFGGQQMNGSVNLDGRLIALNRYHPEHGIVSLTSIPPFTDADRYQQKAVRAYRASLVMDGGFGVQFAQAITERATYLLADALPFMRLSFADGSYAECLTGWLDGYGIVQWWRCSQADTRLHITGTIWVQRSAYTQLTEGGVRPMPSNHTHIISRSAQGITLENPTLNTAVHLSGITEAYAIEGGAIQFDTWVESNQGEWVFGLPLQHDAPPPRPTLDALLAPYHNQAQPEQALVVSRARTYGTLSRMGDCLLTDHMILPLLWTRDSYYVAKALYHLSDQGEAITRAHLQWIFSQAWRGTYCKKARIPLPRAWGRAYMANGMAKDNGAFQLDQQLYPFLELAEYTLASKQDDLADRYQGDVQDLLILLEDTLHHSAYTGLYPTDETPADDDIPLHYHFSSHILLWRTLGQLTRIYPTLAPRLIALRDAVQEAIPRTFIAESNEGKPRYAYATDGAGSYHHYHDANDIPLVMMPLWGFCDKDDELWRNTLDFAFSNENPGFYDGVLGSVHSPAPWALGDAQELIFCKIVGDRDRYQRVWKRVEKSAQWDGALPEAYNISDYSVYSRHWFAWTNAMIALADSLPWDWHTQGKRQSS